MPSGENASDSKEPVSGKSGLPSALPTISHDVPLKRITGVKPVVPSRKARYGVPFIITEWNTGPEQTETYRANYITTQLGEFYPARKTHNIQSVMYYVLDSGDNTYGIMTNSVALNPSYSAFTSFTASHPDN